MWRTIKRWMTSFGCRAGRIGTRSRRACRCLSGSACGPQATTTIPSWKPDAWTSRRNVEWDCDCWHLALLNEPNENRSPAKLMSSNSLSEKIKPCLLDRLTDDDPGGPE